MMTRDQNFDDYETKLTRAELSQSFTHAPMEVSQRSAVKPRWMAALVGDFTWTLLGNGTFAACQWGVIIVLAKLVTAVGVGQYSLGQAILAPILMLLAFQLRTVIASDVNNQFTTREYFGFRLITISIGVLLAILVAYATTRSVLQTQIVGVIGLIQMAEQTSDTLYGFRQRRGNLVRPALSMILKGPVGLLALTVALWMTHSVLVGLTALLATRFLVLIFYDLKGALGSPDSTVSYLSAYFPWSRHLRLFRLVFFIGLMTMLIALVGMIPRYFVEAFCGPRELGVFGAISSLISIGLMPVGALGMAAFVPLARAFSNGSSGDFLKILSALVGLSLSIGIGGVTVAYVAGPQILTKLFRPEYAGYTDVFRWIMVVGAISFVTNSLGASVTAARIFKPQVILLVVVAIAEAAGCWALTPRFGLTGAVWSCLGAILVQFVGITVILCIHFPRRAPVAVTVPDLTC